MTPLQAYISSWLAVPAIWGDSDCCMTMLDWVDRVRGTSVAEDWRWTYSTAEGAQRATQFFTRPLDLCQRVLEQGVGLAPTTAPVRGDVGCFKWPAPDGRILPSAALCVGPGAWVLRSSPGAAPGFMQAAPSTLIGAWGVGYVET